MFITTASQTIFTIIQNPNAIYNAPGSSTPGCEATNDCFIPSMVTIDVGSEVIWENTDNAAHTITSGTPEAGPDGHWDSSLVMAGGSFSFMFHEAGSYDYFCMVHPWMAGLVIVEAEAAEEPEPEAAPVVEEEAPVVEEEVHESVPPTMSVGSTTMTGNTGPGDMLDLSLIHIYEPTRPRLLS